MEVEGVGEVLPSSVELHVTAIEEHLCLPLGQALLIVQTKLKFLVTFDGPSHYSQ